MDPITKALYETWKQIVTEGKWEPYIDPKTGKTEHRFVGGNDVIDPNKYIKPKPSPGPRPFPLDGGGRPRPFPFPHDGDGRGLEKVDINPKPSPWRPGPRPNIDPDRRPIIPDLTPKPKPRPGTGDGGWGGAQPAQPRYDEDDNYIGNAPAIPIKRQEDPIQNFKRSRSP